MHFFEFVQHHTTHLSQWDSFYNDSDKGDQRKQYDRYVISVWVYFSLAWSHDLRPCHLLTLYYNEFWLSFEIRYFRKEIRNLLKTWWDEYHIAWNIRAINLNVRKSTLKLDFLRAFHDIFYIFSFIFYNYGKERWDSIQNILFIKKLFSFAIIFIST